ncbi:MAG: hypothetical protein H5T64_10545 [Chloroflexi bacterium]|nr:hypothetical protein [Chloroflexota bacterium]
MRNDPFAELSGLDQKLFTAPPKADEKGVSGRSKQRTDERPDVRNKRRTSVGKEEETSQRPAQPTVERLTERRPYDFYRDQVLWLNKTKVEIQEKYGQRVTANAMVQLAVDLLMQDYKRRKERSKLVTELVFNQSTEQRPSGGT